MTFLTDRIPSRDLKKHVVEYYLDLLRAIQVPIKTTQMKLDVPPQDVQWTSDAWLKGHKIDPAKPWIAVLPGGGAN